MSANKFKVGDKVKVRKGLVANKFYDNVRCTSPMTAMGGRVLTIDRVERGYYKVKERTFCWTDEMLEPAEKTLDNLCVGDFVRNITTTRKVLAKIDGCCLLSFNEDYDTADTWLTADELSRYGYCLIELPQNLSSK